VGSAGRVDLFGRVPLRFFDALNRGEITFRQFAIGCALAIECFPRGEAAHTVRALRDRLGYASSADSLREDLVALKPDWIDFEVKERQRAPYVFRLTGLAIASTAAGTEPRPRQSPRDWPQSGPQTRGSALPLRNGDFPITGADGLRRGGASDALSSPLLSISGEDKEHHEGPGGPGQSADERDRPPWEMFSERRPDLFLPNGDRLFDPGDPE
jgi:hypothetical protein